MVLETFIVINVVALISKTIYKKINDKHETYHKIVNDGLYHITTKENIEKIIESGHLNPSNNLISLGFKKTFFFAGTPSFKDIQTNIAAELGNETIHALRIKPDFEELANFKARTENDGAVAYEGKYKIKKENVSKVEMIYDFDKEKNLILREKTEEEYKEYKQPEEIKKKLNAKNKLMASLKGLGIATVREYVEVGKMLKKNSVKLIKNLNNEKNLEKLREEREKLLEIKENDLDVEFGKSL